MANTEDVPGDSKGKGGVNPRTQPEETFRTLDRNLYRKWSSASNEVQEIILAGREALKNESAVMEFLGKFRSLEKYFSKCEELYESMEDAYANENKLDEFRGSKRSEQHKKVKQFYFEALTIYEKLNARKQAASCPPSSLSNVTFSDRPSGSSTNLPRIHIPKFDGKYSNWPKFRDTFTSIVDQSPNLSPMEKFHYLSSALMGSAAAVISTFSLEEKNYKLAWKALTDVYENKRLLANAYLAQLMQFKPPPGKPNVQSLLNFLSNVADNISAFKLLNIPDQAEFILFYMAFRCLDNQTKEQFELANKDVEFPTFETLIKHVRDKCLALQLTEGSFEFELNSGPNLKHPATQGDSKLKSYKPSSRFRSTLVASPAKVDSKNSRPIEGDRRTRDNTVPQKCIICSETHALLHCTAFYALSPEERLNRLKSWTGCLNCLNSFHTTSNCRSKWHCRFCPQRHHTLLHIPNPVSTSLSNLNSSNSAVQQTLHTSALKGGKIEVILGTAWANFVDTRGKYQKVRIVLDSGSCHSFITTRCLHRLGLNMTPTNKRISSIGGSLFDGAKGIALCTLRSPDNSYDLSTEAIVVKNITNYMPVVPVPYDIWRHYVNFDLADAKFWKPAPIDFLLGADLYGEILKGGITTIRDDLPKLFDSVLGSIVMGRYVDHSKEALSANLFSTCLFSPSFSDDVSFELSKFWEIEQPTKSRKTWAPDEQRAEDHFCRTHYRTESGRYVVRLPFKNDNVEFPSSYSLAKHRLLNQESKLKKNPNLAVQYHSFLREYLDLGHMQPTSEPSKCVIPHHCVSKIDRGEHKIRVVFDGSAGNTSLNSNLLVGPPLQNDIRDILLNFRAHAVVFVADAVKCYRQILVDPQDRPYQHILWRFDPSEAFRTYELRTVTYGLSCSPFLSLRVLQALVHDEGKSFPRAAEAITRDIYVDDLATGANSIDAALELQKEVVGLMRRGGFELGKWASNTPQLTAAVHANENSPSQVSWYGKENTTVKILGLTWDSTTDLFSYQVSVPSTPITKRGILSTVARVYDPLGFLAPFVFVMKSYIQVLWKLKLDWDDEVPADLSDQWHKLLQHIEVLPTVKIPRFVLCERPITYQIVGFSDASTKGYCGTLYIVVESENGISSHLLIAKTKLAPVKATSIPRLELCGAYLLAKLYESLPGFLALCESPSRPPKFFTDSTIVLGWLKTPTYKLNTFVGNRVAHIAELTNIESWSHVEGSENPSDLGSRGCSPNELATSVVWWHGPCWLKTDSNTWPCNQGTSSINLPEIKASTMTVLIASKPHLQECIDWMERVSSYKKLIRIVALFNQGMSRYKTKEPVHDITETEYLDAEILCVKAVQRFYLFNGNAPNVSNLPQNLRCLNPYLDHRGLVRVGGRLTNSSIPESHKHPILLPREAHLSRILVDEYHLEHNHPGPNLQQAIIQLRFWIPSLRRLVRQRSFNCVKCFKSKAKFAPPIMGDLPSYRLQGGRSFLHVGCDFAGPFSVRESTRRKAPVTKAYLCLYVCMTTKAMHLETVSNLSTEAFLASFSRFISRRGLPTDLYSDCGSNFKGAARELQELAQWFSEEQTQRAIQHFSTPKGIRWHFNPPYSPHFGGLWEAGVKSVKRHLYLSARSAALTYEEIDTLFCKIEAILNSRPLCPLSTDPGEINYLSPGHFLIGDNLLQPPEPSLLDLQENRLNRWQLVKQISQQVWQRWRLEYLATLQARNKWRKREDNLRIGDLVIIRTDAPQLNWPTGRVIDVHPGKDGVVRVVTLRTSCGTYQRSAANLIPLLPITKPETTS